MTDTHTCPNCAGTYGGRAMTLALVNGTGCWYCPPPTGCGHTQIVDDYEQRIRAALDEAQIEADRANVAVGAARHRIVEWAATQ